MSSLTIALVFIGVFSSMTKISGAEHWDLCKIPEEDIRCREYYEQWGFDEKQGKCIMYTYGGCQDYNTGFRTQGECLQTCAGISQPEIETNENYHHEDYGVKQGNAIITDEWLLNIINQLENQPPKNVKLPFFGK